jgi:hypothetical protein
MSTININISKVDLSLDLVDNTSDLNKPISTATQTALDLKVDKVTGSRLITSAESTLLGNTSGTNTGDQNLSGLVPYTGATTDLVMPLSTNIVLMNALMTNAIAYVDNSNNLQTLSTFTYPNLTELSRVKGITSSVQTQLNAKEDITNKATDFSTINDVLFPTVKATNDRINSLIADLVDSSPTTLDTLNELAAAIGDDPNFSATIMTLLGDKQSTLVSGTNLKTINGNSLLGSGNLSLGSGGLIAITNKNTGLPTFYTTPELALAGAVAGDEIEVYAGTYTLTSTATTGYAKEGVNWYFHAGAIFNKATAGSMFNLVGFTSGGNVFGQGSFYKTSNVGKIFNMGDSSTGNSSVDATFEFNICSSTIDVCIVNHSAYSLTTKGAYCVSTGSAAMWLGWGTSGGALVNVTSIRSTASTAIRTWGNVGCPYVINASLVVSTVADGVHGTGGTYNIGYCSGTNGYNLGYYRGNATITGNSSSIVFYSLSLLLNGRTELLTVSQGNVVGGFATNLTVSGGNVQTTVGEYYPSVLISGGVSTITLKSNGLNLNVSGGILNIANNHSSTGGLQYNTGQTVSGGRLNILCPLYFANMNQGLLLSSGMIYLSASGSINMVGTDRTFKNAGIRFQGGKIISSGGTITVAESNCLPITVEITNRDIKVLSAGLNTNSILDLLSGKKQKMKFTVYAVATTSLAINSTTISESNTGTYNTKALMADRITALINASALNTVVIATYTASNDYFELEALVVGIPYTFNTVINLSTLYITEGSYTLTNVTGGLIIEDVDVEC